MLRRGVKVWLEAAMVHGPFHGDVHAGNIWVLDDGRAAYLDFGIMGELTDEWKELMRDLFYTSMIDSDFTRVARAYKRVGAFPTTSAPTRRSARAWRWSSGPMLDGGLGAGQPRRASSSGDRPDHGGELAAPSARRS